MQKSTGLLLLGGATALFVLPKLISANSDSSNSSGGGSGGFVFVPTGLGTSEVTNPNTPSIVINEASLPSYDAPTDSTKKSSSSSTSGDLNVNSDINVSTQKVGSYADYQALPDDSPTKKAFASQYPELSLGEGKGSIVPTYGLGAGGTATYIPSTIDTTKKENGKSSGSWFSRLFG